jgi:hypothetical protein
MKSTNPMLFAAVALAAMAVLAGAPLAAAPDRLTVPLSDPSKPAKIEVSLVMGSIRVTAGKAGEVVIGAEVSKEDEGDGDNDSEPVIAGKSKDKADRSHMRRLPNNSLDLTAEEEKNRVQIGVNSWSRTIDLEIQVPAGSALALSSVNDGELVVEGIGGELELSNTNGDITVRDARGPVNANTVNGDITIVFSGTIASAPMAFSTLNGDVDLTLPGDAKLDVRLRSDNGEIYCDFDVALEPKAARVEQDRSKGKYRVSVAKELTGRIGGGGPEIFLKTFNGDIVLRKR